MKIIYATYVDNQKQIQYPLDFLLSENPVIKVYCSDEENKEYLLNCGIDSEVVGIKITEPKDIATAQNKCVDIAFEKYDPDFVVWIQADMYITEYGHKLIEEYCNKNIDNLNCVVHLRVQHIRLFYIACQSSFGVSIIGRDCKERFAFDGAYVNGYTEIGFFNPNEMDKIPVVDIGYLTLSQYKRHREQNAKTWGEPNLEKLTDIEYVSFILRKDHGIILDGELIKPSNYLYSLIIDKIGLLDEYEKVKKIINILNK